MTSLAEDILEKGPSLVARRISGGQWGPIPVAEAVEAALSVPGVVSRAAQNLGRGGRA